MSEWKYNCPKCNKPLNKNECIHESCFPEIFNNGDVRTTAERAVDEAWENFKP